VVKFIGLGKEASYAVSVARTHYLDIVRESLNPDQGYIDPETAAYREGRLRIPGPYIVSGDVDILVDPDSILEILSALTGQSPTTPAGTLKTYTFTPQSSLFSVTMEVAPGIPTTGTAKARLLKGAVIKSARFEAPARELITCTLGIHAASDHLRDAGTPTFSTKRPFVFYDGTLYIAGSAVANVEAFRVTVENDVPEDTHSLGSRYLQGIRLGGITISGDMDLAFDDWDQYKRFWGSATATEPSNTAESVKIKLHCTSTDSVAAGSFCQFEIYLPKVYFDTTRANIDRRERIIQGIDFTGIYHSSIQAGVKFTVKTDRSTAWAT